MPAPIASLSLTALNSPTSPPPSEFSFTCDGELHRRVHAGRRHGWVKVAPTSADDPADKAAVTGTKGYSARFSGEVKFAGLRFDIVFDAGAKDTNVLVADYVPEQADGKYTDVRSLVAEVSPTLSEAIPEGISVDLKEVKFVFLKQTESQWAFGLRLGTKIDLSKLPIVGSKLPDPETLAIDNLQILYSSKELTEDADGDHQPRPADRRRQAAGDRRGRHRLRRRCQARRRPEAPARGRHAAPGAAKTTGSGNGSALPAAPKAAPPPSSTDPVTWLDVNKQFGIFSFQRVGVGYQKNVLEFALDASVALGPISFSMQALTVGSPLRRSTRSSASKAWRCRSTGRRSPIGGAFLKVDEQSQRQAGQLVLRPLMVGVSKFSAEGARRLGAGRRSRLVLHLRQRRHAARRPAVPVRHRPRGRLRHQLVAQAPDDRRGRRVPVAAREGAEGEGQRSRDDREASSRRCRRPSIQCRISTGSPRASQFTSFEMIESQAVISVSFGVDVQIGVVGTCSMSFPTGDR